MSDRLILERLNEIEAKLDEAMALLARIMEAIERIAGQPVPGERGLGH